MNCKPGTKKWLQSKGINYEHLIGGESDYAGNVFFKSNEKGSYGIGADILDEFNRDWIDSITITKIRRR